MDDEVTDFICQVHMQLSEQLESRVRELESATYYTLFLLRDSAIVINVQDSGRT